jgi:hypothetical protein
MAEYDNIKLESDVIENETNDLTLDAEDMTEE